MTKGQLEAQISEVVAKFERDFMGRGPKKIKTKIIEDVILVRQWGFLTQAEQKLSNTNEGIELIKRLRVSLFENSLQTFKDLFKDINIDIESIHSDVSTVTGEKVIVITFKEDIEEVLFNK